MARSRPTVCRWCVTPRPDGRADRDHPSALLQVTQCLRMCALRRPCVTWRAATPCRDWHRNLSKHLLLQRYRPNCPLPDYRQSRYTRPEQLQRCSALADVLAGGERGQIAPAVSAPLCGPTVRRQVLIGIIDRLTWLRGCVARARLPMCAVKAN